jgi:hypothetical protein
VLAILTEFVAQTGQGVHSMAALTGLFTLLVAGGIAASAWHGVAYTELATQAGHSRTGTALAMGNSGAFLAFWLVPSAIPMLLSAFGWPAVWLAAAACGALAWPAFAPVPLARRQSHASRGAGQRISV